MSVIKIRPLQVKDADTSYRWRNDEAVWKFTGSRPDRTITVEIEREWLKKVLDDPTSKRFAIIAGFDEKYIGNIQLTNIDSETAQYHIFIGDKTEWGKGYAKEASKLLIDYVRENLNLKKIYLTVHPEHVAAIKLYKSLGFTTVSEEVRMELAL